jgi:hypothetical protein
LQATAYREAPDDLGRFPVDVVTEWRAISAALIRR